MSLRTHARTPLAAALLALPFAVASCHAMIDFDGYKVAPAEVEGSSGSGGSGSGSGSGGSGGAGGSGSGGGAVTSGGGGGSGAAPICGDGTIGPGEQCDDGNDEDNDGCSEVCTYELVDGCPTVALGVGTENVHLRGDTTNAPANANPTCGADSSEYIIKVRALVSGTLKGLVTARYTAVFWAASACPIGSAERACKDANPLEIAISVQAGEEIYVAADGDLGATGDFDLDLIIEP